MRLSIIIPAFNEIGTIARLVSRVEALDVEKQIVLIDDGSDDGTREWIRDYSGEALKIFNETNLGKGACVREGLARAEGDVAVIQDADLEYDPTELAALLEPIAAGEADVVFGSRVLGGKKAAHRRFDLGGRFLTWTINLLFGGRMTDAATCYKMMHRSVFGNWSLVGTGFDLDCEIAVRVLRSRCRYRELPIAYDPRSLAQGKKIRAIDGLYSLLLILRLRLGLL